MSDQHAVKTIRFADVKAILDALIVGRDPAVMRAQHNNPAFGWDTLDRLQKSFVIPDPDNPSPDNPDRYLLIEPSLVAQKRGAETSLVKALRDRQGVENYGQMPPTPPGRHATPEEIQNIVDWLNAGMPE